MSNFILEKSVMRRVYLIWVGRMLLHRTTVRLVLLALFAWEFAAYVFIRAVIQNASHVSGFFAYLGYYVSAFEHTQFMIQGLILGMGVLATWLGFDTIKNLHYAHFIGRRVA